MLFMGSEFGQTSEWNHDRALDWELVQDPLRASLMRWITDLNTLYRRSPALWHDESSGWLWLAEHADHNLLAYQRASAEQSLAIVLNFAPLPRHAWRLGVPQPGTYAVRLNSDAGVYGGSGMSLPAAWTSDPVPAGDHEHSILSAPTSSRDVLEHSRFPAYPWYCDLIQFKHDILARHSLESDSEILFFSH